jgi:hypothetical protein
MGDTLDDMVDEGATPTQNDIFQNNFSGEAANV